MPSPAGPNSEANTSEKLQVAPGITRRHARRCLSRGGGSCTCRPSYQAQAWSAKAKKPVRRTFRTINEARSWRQEAQVDLRRGELNAPSSTLLRDAADHWLSAARAGIVRTRSGEPYKPSAIRSYEAALRATILPELANLRLSAVSRKRVQQLVDGLVGRGLAPSTVTNAVLPLRAIYRRAVDLEEVVVNPTLKLRLPRQRGKPQRVAGPREVEKLLDALPAHHRVLWATAVYTGLRRGELQALRWSCVDLGEGILRVEKSWDRVAGLVEPKSASGHRRVPIPALLRTELIEHRLAQAPAEPGFVFSSTGERPFDASNALRVARRRWRRAGLQPVGFHQCRHGYASWMIAAGVNAKALSAYLGHSSISVTMDRYGHLMPGNEREAAERLDTYLDRAAGGSGV